MGHDFVIVGAGSAGCVLAARLSEVARVLLVEAGPDYPDPENLPEDLASGWRPTKSHDWGYQSVPGSIGRSISLPRGRLVGGCSSTNATAALRGAPVDYDAWGAAGLKGWRFEEVLPFFVRLESDEDFGSEPWHGVRGPIPIRRYGPNELNPVQAAAIEALNGVGIPRIADHNRPGAMGVGPLPVNTKEGRRISTAIAYLGPIRNRDTLEIRADCMVADVVIRDGRARGVRTYPEGQILEADRVIISAGAYASPSILMRSGFGDPAELTRLGLGVRVGLRGVGRNLIDHPGTSIDLAYKGEVRPGPVLQSMATLRSSAAGRGGYDLQIFAGGPGEDAASPTGASLELITALMKPRSRGRVRLTSTDPTAPPWIDPGYFTEQIDVDRMVEALELARDAARLGPLHDLSGGIELAPGPTIDGPGLAAYVRESCWSYHHPVGTCAMGADPDQGAVVDATGAVFGVDGLHVVDASVMPDIPAANTNLPTIMVAERIASILADHSGRALAT